MRGIGEKLYELMITEGGISVPLHGMGGVFLGLIVLSVSLYILGKIVIFFQNRPRKSLPGEDSTGEKDKPAEEKSSLLSRETVAAISLALTQVLSSSYSLSRIPSPTPESGAGDASPWRISGRLTQINRQPKSKK